MKSKLLYLAGIALFLCFSLNMSAQTTTAGTLTFTYNQPIPSSPAPNKGIKNILAIWIENSAGVFIKTRNKYAVKEVDHLPIWSVKSGGILSNSSGANSNITDATTGATLSGPSVANPSPAYGTRTITWDGKNVVGSANGVTVPDGDYTVWIESSWVDSGVNNHGTIASFTFHKGPTAQHLTPVSPVTYFNTVIIDWTPTALGVEENVSPNTRVVVYPNPSNGMLSVDFKNEIKNIRVSNMLGQVVYEEKVDVSAAGTTKNIDLSRFGNGTYILNVTNNEGTSNYKVILDK
ncbi:MAG: T9SS type A sorting domain-containing protein [Flavobacterium sp.]|uniref:T9SS type A sorting domain-containing protein n=1 Tax=Flavobacterium sp. TaxID=239 RepID=UPI0026346677|nr:T9SS type A sorting domain-containing protein [Flavobacterium sp.]MDD5152045.1 T9SS type A sorting domain-containing protein [Flavobacterium sp.]